MKDLKKYIFDVKSQLYHNASEYDKKHYITYLYSDEQIDSNMEYFKECMNDNLSTHNSLELFSNYLNNKL